jgi:tRNA U34 5-methylaminomethyl-2-thiouridine-forming methyltransferase MnmC
MVGEFELVTLKTGLKSLRSVEHGETFHPVTGPRAEADTLHVVQQRLVERSLALPKGERFVIWDVGLGAAANVLAAIEALEPAASQVEIHSFDKTTAPLEFAQAHAAELGYLLPHLNRLSVLVAQRHVSVSPGISWRLHLGDFRERVLLESIPAPHAVIYDPYSPSGNPEMWTLDHFTNLRKRLDPNRPCLLTNYTRSTAVRTTLLLAGFYVGVGCEVGEKAETTVASNHFELLDRPLSREWLTRAWISKNSAPLREASYSLGLISEADFRELEKAPHWSRLP